MNLFDLTGRVAVVTGAGRGIGLAIAEGLALHGATVVLGGRSLDKLEEGVRLIAGKGGKAVAVSMDVTDESSVIAARDKVMADLGRIDILVNNAGIDPHYASMEKTKMSEWDEIIDVNLSGVFRSCRYFGEPMIRAKRGSIISISSIAGHIGLKRQVPYSASKGGVEQLTKALALDWASDGIRVNAIAYGFVETDMTSGMTAHPHIGPRLLSRIPMNRFGRLSDVPGAAIFLASDAASFVTGHSLRVDGGWTAG